MAIKRSSTKRHKFTTDVLLNNNLIIVTQDRKCSGQSQVFVMSHANREGITLKPTQKSATASETINALVLVRRFRLLQTRKIVNPFPVIARNERTQPRIQNQVSILTVKGSSYQLYNTTNILHKYQGHMTNGYYGAFLHDVTATILVFQNNETATMLACQPILWEFTELFSSVNALFCSNKFA